MTIDSTTYLDQTAFRILDGSNGDVLFEDLDWWSPTVGEMPVVVDLDGDGSVEIVITALHYVPEGDPFIRVYTHPRGEWPPGTQVWAHERWSGTSLHLDGTVPEVPAAPWLETGRWRGQPEVLIEGSDLRAEELSTCMAESEAPAAEVKASIRVVNGGPWVAEAGMPVAVYAADGRGARTLVEVLTLTEELPVGWASASLEVSLTRESVGSGLVVVAGDDGAGEVGARDCDASNNEVKWASGG